MTYLDSIKNDEKIQKIINQIVMKQIEEYMENKYYTPDIEDIRVGYECEREETVEGYKPYVFDLQGVRDYIQFEISDYKDFFIKTPYLTKEQIESEGWEYMRIDHYWNAPDKVIHECFKKGNHWLLFSPNRIIKIIPIDPSLEGDFEHLPRYVGDCPSINEFRIITRKLLKIN